MSIQQSKSIKILVTMCCLVLTACNTAPSRAPVVERSVENRELTQTEPIATPKSVVKIPEQAKGNYVVKKGDTLYKIALEHGQSYSDLVTWNSLKNPNDIKVDQVLRVAPFESNSTDATRTNAVAINKPLEVKPLTLSSNNNKSSPRGDKRVYSEDALAELQKTDASAAPNNKPIVQNKSTMDEQPANATENVDWMWPTTGKTVAEFDDAKNKGLDIVGKIGQDILAAAAGKVMFAGNGIRGYGSMVIIKHSNNFLSAYAHNKAILVKEGQDISKGQKIAEMGNTDSDIVKLHFEIRLQGKPVDPAKYLPVRQ